MVTNDRRSEVTASVKKRTEVKLLISGRSSVKLVSITTAVFLVVSTSLIYGFAAAVLARVFYLQNSLRIQSIFNTVKEVTSYSS